MKRLIISLLVCSLFSGCGAGYVVSELKGEAKPEGGIAEVIPATKAYSANNSKVWKACLDVLDDQGYIYDTDSTSGRVKSDPRVLGDPNKVALVGATYYSIVILKVDGSSVTFKARFNKKSTLVQSSENIEYPEKENELRRDFFVALTKKLNV